ncbi:MAG: hypothetical protein RRY79_06070 [Clostridia bacterium]
MKINKLPDLHLEGKVDRITYEGKYEQLRNTLADLKADPYMLTFVFKTGLTTKIDGRKTKGKNKSKSEDKKCSYQSDKSS